MTSADSKFNAAFPIRVLIVDDIASVRSDLHQLLKLNEGVEVIGEAENGEEAVKLAEHGCPDVILMDLEMPVMDGYQATQQIKKHCPNTRIVGLSIHSQAEAGYRARQAGVDVYLEKSSSIQAILMAIRFERSK